MDSFTTLCAMIIEKYFWSMGLLFLVWVRPLSSSEGLTAHYYNLDNSVLPKEVWGRALPVST